MGAAPDPAPALERRVNDFAARRIPVLGRTVAALARIKASEDSAHPRDVAQAVLRDPMLTLLLVRHLQTHRSHRKLEDITTVEHAIMMIGMRQFFSAFEAVATVEDTLKGRPEALAGLMQVIGRARAAAVYARTLAALRADLSGDEVVVAALLHDMAEMLLWCFDPECAAALAQRLAANPGLRSAEAQQELLGFRLLDLQLALIRRWGLPELFLSLMDDAHAELPRVQNVALSVALSRHAWNGWSNAALPSDIEGIARLLGMPQHAVHAHIFNATLLAVGERGWYGEALGGLVHLPGLPRPRAAPGVAPVVAARARIYDTAAGWLRSIAQGVPLPGHPRQGLVRDIRHDALAAVAAFMDGVTAGLGYASALFLAPPRGGQGLPARFLAGDAAGAAYLQADPAAASAVAGAVASRGAVVHIGSALGGRPRGLFAWPVVAVEEVIALVVAIGPAEMSLLGPASFKRFKELGTEFDTVARILGASAFETRDAG